MPGDPIPFLLRTKAIERLAEVLVLISWVEVEHRGLHCRETCDQPPSSLGGNINASKSGFLVTQREPSYQL